MSKNIKNSKKTFRSIVLILITLGALFAADKFFVNIKPTKNDWEKYHNKTFNCVKCVDGDTIDLGIPDKKYQKTRIRLWGVDTPESVHPRKPIEHFGPEASAYTKSLVLNKKVRVELVPNHLRGKYGRLLAYIYLPDGRLLNRVLIKKGFAFADTRFAHPKKQEFITLMKQARRKKIGLWRDFTPADLPYYIKGSSRH